MMTFVPGSSPDEWRGLSSDDKNSLINSVLPNGSTYLEMDGDKNLYFYDKTNKVWIKQ